MEARSRRTRHITARFGEGGAALPISDPEAFKVLYEPARFQIVRLLDEPMTAKEISEAVDRPLTSLYYHLNLLVEHGLISVVEERASGRAVERVFRRTADAFSASGDVAEVVDAMATGPESPLGSAVRHVRRSLAGRAERSSVRISIDSTLQLTADQARELAERLRTTVDDFAEAAGSGDARDFRVLIAIADEPADGKA